ncbi:DUF1622 domain-containing protein [Arsukibacterium sp.]|uniref:DUF1622 domain-containing protein n=1 Tax=Arsukibacterium sp. TaxID=1977258 RepID=UPI00299F1C47|nr:DUF1622 domain-containing protein [Arsukibacterium sp.]MDX1536302.1 DUF1622 domain-containing protein [Arsukibacterium sp.]
MIEGTHKLLGSLPQWCAVSLELLGIGIITVIAIYSLLHGCIRLVKGDSPRSCQQEIRQRLGRGILLGLEFLIAADIIYTVAVELTLSNVGVLALVVLIRSFLSFTLEVELSGKWPWQLDKSETAE